MAFIGNTVQTQGFTPAIDYFSGNASTVTFTLSRPVVSVAQMIVSVANVIQNPASAYTVSGNSITFSSAPPSGTNNIWVEYTSLITTYAAISQSPSVIGDITASGGYLATGSFNNSFLDGTIVDYVTGMGRITAGPADGITLYNGGTTGRTALLTAAASGQVGIGTISPVAPLTVYTSSGNTAVVQKSGGAAAIAYGSDTTANFLTEAINGGGVNFYTGTGSWASPSWTSRMVINSSGYVTTPYQPAFSVGRSNPSVASNTYVIYDLVQSNIGSCYNSSTGTFTAPVAGTYNITYSMLASTNSTVYRMDLYKNNAIFSLGAAGSDWTEIRLDQGSGFSGRYLQGSKSYNLYLAANDYLNIKYSADDGSASGNSTWFSFTGTLLG